jgi:drug/metabolite transporter (DMT)-like permease
MFLFYFSIALAILSSMLYHSVMRATPVGVNPALSLVVTYALSLLICVPLFIFFPLKQGLAGEVRQLNWATYVLALALVGLEVSYLLAYRAGWDLGKTALVVNATVTLLLVPVGLLVFRERITPVNVAGIVVCVVGLVLVNWGR